MAGKVTFKAPFRRRRLGKTNYNKRLALLKSREHRLVARRTNKHVIVQFIGYEAAGDRTVAHVNSGCLGEFGWKAGKKSLPAAYLAGLLAGVRAKKAGVESAVLDIGFAIPHRKGWWGSAVKGAIDAGIKVPVGEEAIPDENRIRGKHIEDFARSDGEKAAGSKDATRLFEETKQKILASK
jgi:large subunit ribosomal protein L18